MTSRGLLLSIVIGVLGCGGTIATDPVQQPTIDASAADTTPGLTDSAAPPPDSTAAPEAESEVGLPDAGSLDAPDAFRGPRPEGTFVPTSGRPCFEGKGPICGKWGICDPSGYCCEGTWVEGRCECGIRLGCSLGQVCCRPAKDAPFPDCIPDTAKCFP